MNVCIYTPILELAEILTQKIESTGQNCFKFKNTLFFFPLFQLPFHGFPGISPIRCPGHRKWGESQPGLCSDRSLRRSLVRRFSPPE